MAHHWTRLCWWAVLMLCAWGRPLKEPAKPAASSVLLLNSNSFDSHLNSLPPDTRVLLEFFASWCPACRRFQPTYDKVAAFFHTKTGTIQPRVVVAKVDCAEEVELCGEFDLSAYPTMYLAPATSFQAHSLTNATQYPLSRKRNAQDIVSWVAKELSADWVYEEVPADQVAALQANLGSDATAAVQQVELEDVERATVELLQQVTMNLQGAAQRDALLDLLHLLAAAHPSSRCQEGARELEGRFEELWPAEREAPAEELLQWPICGEAAKTGLKWVTCDDRTHSRGFTCGMWLLLHSLAARYPEEEADSGKAVMAGVNAFARNFFRCEECARHFSAMLDEEDAKAVGTKREAMLWLWRTHNKVNARLAKVVAEGSAEVAVSVGPKKVQWPPVELCPTCREQAPDAGDGNITWSEDAVHSFLLTFFGSSGRSTLTATATAPLPRASASGPATSVSQFVLSTLLFTGALLVVWYLASASLRKHRPHYRRSWG